MDIAAGDVSKLRAKGKNDLKQSTDQEFSSLLLISLCSMLVFFQQVHVYGGA